MQPGFPPLILHPFRRRRLRLAIGAMLLCADAAAAVQLSGLIEIGGLYLTDERSGAQGSYGPAIHQGIHPLGSLDLSVDGEGSRTRIQGSMTSPDFGDFGVTLLAKDGDSVRLDYQRMARRGDDGLSLLQSGADILTLPPGFVPANTTQDFDLSVLQPVELGTNRERYGIAARLFAGNDWRTDVSVREERRRGVQEIGAMVGVDPLEARSIILPAPVDQQLRELDAALSWERDGRQLRIAYRGSLFTNQHQAHRWEVPFLAAGDDPLPDTGRLGTSPDNHHHSISIDAGTRLGKTSRLSASASLSRMQQDEDLLPYSTGASLTALPRNSAEARVDVLRLALNASARPLDRLTLSARHRYYRSDDRIPRTRFEPVLADTIAGRATISRPYDHFQAKTLVRAVYRAATGSRILTEWTHDIVGRDLPGNGGHTRENGLKLGLQQTITSRARARLSLLHADRNRHGHDAVIIDPTAAASCPEIVLVDPDPDGGAPREIDRCIGQHPDMRRFMLGDRIRQRLQTAIDWWPTDDVDFELGWSISRDRYRDQAVFDDTVFGLRDSRERMLYTNLNWSAHESWSISIAYSREYLDAAQTGRDMAHDQPSAPIDSSTNWRARSHDRADTISAGLRLDLPDGRTRLALDLAHIRERNRIRLESRLPAAQLPDDGARRQYAELHGEHEPDDRILLKAGVRWEAVMATDRSDSGIEVGEMPGLNGVLALRSGDTDYDVLLIWSSITYLW